MIGIQHGERRHAGQPLAGAAFARGDAAGEADTPLGALPAGRFSHGGSPLGLGLSDAQGRSKGAP